MPRPYGVTIVVAMTTKKDCVRELQAESAALSVNSVIKGNNKLLKTENAHLKAQVAELQHVKKRHQRCPVSRSRAPPHELLPEKT